MRGQVAMDSKFFGKRLNKTSVVKARRSANKQRGGRLASLVVRNENVLIANTKGGGHAFIGLYLARKLVSEGHKVTILNDGDMAKVTAKAPYDQYDKLAEEGVEILWGSPADADVIGGLAGKFDVVYDNNGKDLDTCKPLIDAFQGSVKNFVFVSSAGMYKPDNIEPCAVEDSERKSSAGHYGVEEYLAESGAPYTIFRPLYIYGKYTAKGAYLDFYLDRILRDRPVPIPAPGIQMTSLTHVEDVASMMSMVIGNENAIGKAFNLCSDRYVSLAGIANMCGKVAGKDVKVVLYDPKAFDPKKDVGFPMRTSHFFASPEKAKEELGWKSSHRLMSDLEEIIADYKSSGRLEKDIDFSVDDEILTSANKVPVSV